MKKEGWVKKKLGEVCKIQNGFAFKSNLFSDEGKPILRISNIQKGKISFDNIVYFKEDSYSVDLSKYMVYPDDILMALSGATTGKVGLNSSNQILYLNQRVALFKEDKKEIHHKFLFHYLNNKGEEALRNAGGAAQPNLSTDTLKTFEILYPPLPEQQQIVSELDCLQGIIDKKKAQLQELDKLVQSIFYTMFGDPVNNEKGWSMARLKDVSEIVSGSTPKTNIDTYWNGNHYWVTPAEIGKSRYIECTERTITDEALQHNKLQLLPVGTVLLSSRAPIGKVCITKVPMYCNQGFKNVVCSSSLINEYVYQYLLERVSYIQSLGNGATFKEISKKITENIPIPVPPLSLQQEFADKINFIEQQKERIQKSLQDTETLFQSRMDYYFG